jgi:hypothetical protein
MVLSAQLGLRIFQGGPTIGLGVVEFGGEAIQLFSSLMVEAH